MCKLMAEPAFTRALVSLDDDTVALVRSRCGTEWVEIDLQEVRQLSMSPSTFVPSPVSA